MWNEPTEKQLAKIPKIYETEKIPVKEKKIYMHFFIGGCDWYVAEFDDDDVFFGYVIINSDFESAEWGYFSFSELKKIKINQVLEIDRDLHWKICKAEEIKNIQKGSGWSYEKK